MSHAVIAGKAREKVQARIGIFQARWPLQSQTVNCASLLAQAGYAVDLFLYETAIYCDLESILKNPDCRIHFFSRCDEAWRSDSQNLRGLKSQGRIITHHFAYWGSRFRRVLSSLRKITIRSIRSRHDPLPPSILRRTNELIRGKEYRCFIGIEKAGLIWAGITGDCRGIPYLYYSLELYTRDHPDTGHSRRDRNVKQAEECYHGKSAATIIQDQSRAEVLLKDNGVPSSHLLYVAVSVLGAPYMTRATFLQERFAIRPDQTVILQFGLLYERRLSAELVEAAQALPAGAVVVLHGYGLSEEYIRRIETADTKNRVFISREMVPPRNVLELISSAHIGLALYSSSTVNDVLTEFASEKMALYLQCGIPVIAFDYPGYRRLMEKYRCGVLIETLRDLPRAVERIISSYDEYRRQAYRCFLDLYDYEKNFRKVVEWIDALEATDYAGSQRDHPGL